jgi:hypothetical protein
MIADIQTALVNHLKTFPTLPPLQEENTRNIGMTGQTFVRATLLPAQPRQLSVGQVGKDLRQGLFQIDVFVPQDTGIAAANQLADALVEHFPRVLALAQGDVIVHTPLAWRQTGGRNGVFYQVPVVIQWSAIT